MVLMVCKDTNHRMSSGNCISPQLDLLPNSVVSIGYPILGGTVLTRILVIFLCSTKVLLSDFVVCLRLIDAFSVLGASATGAGVKYLLSLRSLFWFAHLSYSERFRTP